MRRPGGSPDPGSRSAGAAWVPCQPWMPHPPDPPRRVDAPDEVAATTAVPRVEPAPSTRRRTARAGPAPPGRHRRSAPTPDDPEGPPFSPHHGASCWSVGAVLAVVAGLVLRFWTRSDLWLDEALTVNIARHPLHELPGLPEARRRAAALLRAAPLLDGAVRHLGRGRPVAVRAVRRGDHPAGLAGRPAARRPHGRPGRPCCSWPRRPFAVRYDTETRMYSLVALLTVLGFLALDRALRPPRAGNLVAVAAVTGLLLYSHYWSIYLLGHHHGVAGCSRPGGDGPSGDAGARAALVATVVGCLTFLPWVPTFLFQSRHTGTPWATPATLRRHGQRRGVVRRRQHQPGPGPRPPLLRPDRARPVRPGHRPAPHRPRHPDAARSAARWPSSCSGTLAAAIVGGLASNSAFDARYASVVFIPLILLVSLGVTVFRDRHVRVGDAGPGHGARDRRLGAQRDHQPDPGRRGGGRHRGHRPGRGRGGLLPGPARAGRRPPAARRPLPPGDLPPGHRARPSSTGWTTPTPSGRLAGHLRPAGRVPGRRRPPDLHGVGAGLPGVRRQVRGDRPDAAGRTPPTTRPGVVVGRRQDLLPADVAGPPDARPGPDRRGRGGPDGADRAAGDRRRPASAAAAAPGPSLGRAVRRRSCRPGWWPGCWWPPPWWWPTCRCGRCAPATRRPCSGSTTACSAWDAGWYRSIADHGYAAAGRESLRFFPLFPLSGRGLGHVPGVGHRARPGPGGQRARRCWPWPGCCLLVRHDLGDADAGPPVGVAAGPGPVGLLPGAGLLRRRSCCCARWWPSSGIRTDRWWWAAAAGLAAGAVRPVGVLLVVPVAVELWSRRHDLAAARARVGSGGRPGGAAGRRRRLPGLGRPPVRRRLAALHRPAAGRSPRPARRTVRRHVARRRRRRSAATTWAAPSTSPGCVVCVALVVVAWRRLPRRRTPLFATAVLVVSLSSTNLDSFERYALGAFPLVVAASTCTSRRAGGGRRAGGVGRRP